jgi:DNA-binding NarL/FixJ family response regulator
MPIVADMPTSSAANATERITVMLVDDHTSIRQMLAFLLPGEGPYEIVAQSASGFDALQLCKKLRPHVMILDVMLPELNGIEIVRRLTAEECPTRLLVYSGTNNSELIAEVLRAEPHGFVHKEDTLETLRQALKMVCNGGRFISAMAGSAQRNQATSIRSLLTDSEIAVLQMIAEGVPQKIIAERLNVAVRTVEYYRYNISQKLGIHDIAGLTKYAIRHGLIAFQ